MDAHINFNFKNTRATLSTTLWPACMALGEEEGDQAFWRRGGGSMRRRGRVFNLSAIDGQGRVGTIVIVR